jgi:hypothetical protein
LSKSNSSCLVKENNREYQFPRRFAFLCLLIRLNTILSVTVYIQIFDTFGHRLEGMNMRFSEIVEKGLCIVVAAAALASIFYKAMPF